ncbi:hypothetical protein ACBP89_27060 [Aneurinibacillus aneurinilyticus]|uniref:hypothetical protein n=1 Tax=Aneurinibacillus aneurinilyticus TaxID=1391 RepID=UPI0035257E13
MKEKYSLKHYKKAEKYLDVFAKKSVKRLSIEEKMILKGRLKAMHSREELNILQALVESELKGSENFAPKNLVYTVLLTALITFMASLVMFVPQYVSSTTTGMTGNLAAIELQKIKIAYELEQIGDKQVAEQISKLSTSIGKAYKDSSNTILDFTFSKGAYLLLSFISIMGLIASERGRYFLLIIEVKK